MSQSISETLSLEATNTCPDVFNVSGKPRNLLRLRSGYLEPSDLAKAKAGTAYVDSFACQKLSFSRDIWGGTKGSTMKIVFEVVNTSYSELSPSVGSDGAASISESTSFEISQFVLDSQNQTATLLLTHVGEDMLRSPGPFSIHFPAVALRCPSAFPLTFTVIPEAAPKSWLDDLLRVVQDVSAAISVVMAMPAVAAQMGMLSGLQDMARCEPS